MASAEANLFRTQSRSLRPAQKRESDRYMKLKYMNMSLYENATINGTPSSNCFDPTARKIGYIFTYCLLLVVSLAGNMLIGIIVYRTKRLRKPINVFIVNMALSDLLFPIFLFTRRLLVLFNNGPWVISGVVGQMLCKLPPFLTDVSSIVSIQSLILIAVDRFGAVMFPLRSPLISSKLCRLFILSTWIVAMAIQSPFLFALKLVENQERLWCDFRWKDTFGKSSSFENYALAVIILFFCLPSVLIALLYLSILLKLKTLAIPGERSDNAREKRERRERNVLKMSIVIVSVFALCWVPHIIYWFMNLFWPDKIALTSCSFRSFVSIATFLASANCAINPCVCFIFSGNYRRGLKNLLCCVSTRRE